MGRLLQNQTSEPTTSVCLRVCVCFACMHAFRDMLITDLAATLTFVELCEEVRAMCSLTRQQPITLKWIDDEGGSDSQSDSVQVLHYLTLSMFIAL